MMFVAESGERARLRDLLGKREVPGTPDHPDPPMASKTGPPLPAWLAAGCGARGAAACHLAAARPAAFDGCRVDQRCAKTDPAFAGSVDEFVAAALEGAAVAAAADDPAADPAAEARLARLHRQTRNRVKKCPACGKANAYTLPNCNSCGQDLAHVAEGFTNNVFTGFIFGVARGPFPFTISLRAQTERMLVFDDLLALTTCHLNCIPTDVYIPDLRSLFADPPRGLETLRRMHAAAWAVTREQFLGNAAWRAKMLREDGGGGGSYGESGAAGAGAGAGEPPAPRLSDEALKAHVCAGLNYPPSQYQLHLQFMLPPFTPFHWQLYQNGGHFTPGRFFPVEYVLAALEAMADAPLPGAPGMPIEEIVSHVRREHGVDYEVFYRAAYARYGRSHQQLANWTPSDFSALVVGESGGGGDRRVVGAADLAGGAGAAGGPPAGGAGGAAAAAAAVSTVLAADKMALQNYGRPYSAEGRPTGTYYQFAKAAPLPEFL